MILIRPYRKSAFLCACSVQDVQKQFIVKNDVLNFLVNILLKIDMLCYDFQTYLSVPILQQKLDITISPKNILGHPVISQKTVQFSWLQPNDPKTLFLLSVPLIDLY